jgi:hypothetical protein
MVTVASPAFPVAVVAGLGLAFWASTEMLKEENKRNIVA